MEATKIYTFASQLREAHGKKAIVEAAQKAANLETQGDIEQASIWRKVESALREMRGPRVS